MDLAQSETATQRAPMAELDPAWLERRRRLGHDIWDEVWNGVLHVPPFVTTEHQALAGDLLTYLTQHRVGPHAASVYLPINLARPGAGAAWVDDFRIPDLLILTPSRLHIRCGSHWEGAPDVVVEIHSPGDEAYEKLEFYRDLDVPEVWIIHRDSKHAEIYLLHGGDYDSLDSDSENWLRSPATGIEMKPTGSGKLAIRVAGDDSTREELPVN